MKRGAIVVGAALLLALILWLAARGHDTPASASTPAPTAAVASAPTTPAAPAPTMAAPQPVEPDDLGPGTPGTEPEVPKAAPPVELSPDTQKLAAEFVPGTTDWDDVPVDESGALSLRILPVKFNVVAPDPIVVWIEVVDRKGQRVAASGAGVRVRRITSNSDADWIELPTTDDGSHRYVATLAPSAAQTQALLGRVLVEGRVEMPGAGVRRIPSGVIYTRGPAARFTGAWRDWIEDGHLRLEAELQVERAGTFTINAQIVGPNREPIAWVRNTAALGEGTQHIDMQVWGKALHDDGIDGPYHVRDVLLVRELLDTGEYEPGRTIEEAHVTKPYKAAEFSSAVWVDPGPQGPQVGPDDPSQQGKPGPIGARVNVGG
jgi:hypothetical protein